MKRKGLVLAIGGFVLIFMAAPLGLSAAEAATPVIKSVSTQAVAISWKASEGFEGYEVVRSNSADGSYAKVGETKNTEYIDKGLNTGYEYFYKIRGYKGSPRVFTSYSKALRAVPKPGKSAILASIAEGQSNLLLWKEVSLADYYSVERSESGGEFVKIGEATEPTYSDKGLNPKSSYEYRVRAIAKAKDGQLVYGEYSNPFSGSAVPMAVPIKAIYKGQHEATLAIEDGTYIDISGVEVFLTSEGKTKYLGEFDLEKCLFTAKGLSNGTTYTFKTKSYKKQDDGTKLYGMYSNGVTITTDKAATSDPFVNLAAKLSVDLVQLTASSTENTAVSAVSMLPSLAITATAAKEKTKEQIVGALSPEMSIEEINYRVAQFTEDNISGTSMTFKQELLVADDSTWQSELQKAGLTASPAGKIEQVAETGQPDDISDQTALAIVNTAGFDGEWENPYGDLDIAYSSFANVDGNDIYAPFMLSEESQYIQSASAKGFIKPYADGKHSFAALLPDEGVRIDDYVRNLTGDKLIEALMAASEEQVLVEIPKFSADSLTDMNGALKTLGITDAFDPQKAQFASAGSGSHIKEIVNSTAINVDENKYQALNKSENAVFSVSDSRYVKLDRPFVYMVIDNDTLIPVIIGLCIKAG